MDGEHMWDPSDLSNTEKSRAMEENEGLCGLGLSLSGQNPHCKFSSMPSPMIQ
jgi:hypothetical protein